MTRAIKYFLRFFCLRVLSSDAKEVLYAKGKERLERGKAAHAFGFVIHRDRRACMKSARFKNL